MLRRRSLLATGLTGLALPAVARAQSGWEPRQPIRLIATFPPGSWLIRYRLHHASDGRGADPRGRAPKLDHVSYRGSAPAMQDPFTNHTERVFDPLTTKVAMIKDGTVVTLAVSAPHRVPAVPDVPTFAEQGLPALTATNWIGISGRKSLPAPVADAVQEAALAAIARPEILAKLADLAFYAPPKPLVGTAYTAMIATFASHWIAVAKRGRNHRLLTGGHPMPDAPALRSRRALATTPLRAS
jgi:tripartite-type tricarboxylate transporter receptor subunit TctC